MDKKINCPYCDNSIHVYQDNEEFITVCPNCQKKYKTIFAKVRNVLERGSRVRDEKIEYRLRVINKANEEKFHKFKSGNDIEIRAGDEVGLIFKKRFLSAGFKSEPSIVMNYRIKHEMRV